MFIILILYVKIVTSLDPATVDLLTPLKRFGEACGYEACPAAMDGMLNVHIVPHTHGELGYTGTFYEHFTGYSDYYLKRDINMKRILDFTITQLWAQKYRTFTLADMPFFFQWWSERDGTVRRMVYQLLRQGRLYLVGGGWGMNDEACTSYHAIIESYTYSLRKLNATFMECGRPLVAWQADVFGHSREFTSLAAQMGFDGLFINPISFDDELTRMTRQGLEFVWRGSDDLGGETDMYTHKLFDGYWSPPGFCFSSLCDDPLIVTADSLLGNAEERVDKFLEEVRFRQAPSYNTSHIMVMMGSRYAYFDASMWFTNIDKLINLGNEKSYRLRKNVYLTYSTPACYLQAVHASKPVLETKQDDMFPMAPDSSSYLSGMYTSYPDVKLLAREGLVFLQMSKQMQVLARLFNNDKVFEEFSWIMGVFQDHNIITGAMRDYVRSYYIEKMYRATQKSTLLLKQAFNKLRNSPAGTIYFRCSFNMSQCDNIGTAVLIHIYNPLAWNVTIPVRLPCLYNPYNVYDPSGGPIVIRSGSDDGILEKSRELFKYYRHTYSDLGNIMITALIKIPEHVLSIPQRYTVADHELVFLAENIPPMGYRTYYLEQLFRTKRSIIKKIQKKNKKYLTKQRNSRISEGKLSIDSSDYSYFDDDDEDETTTAEPETKIIFGNVSRSDEPADNSDVITPAVQPKIIFSNVTNNKNVDETEIVTPNIKDKEIDVNLIETSESPENNATSQSKESSGDGETEIVTPNNKEEIDVILRKTIENPYFTEKTVIIQSTESNARGDDETEIVTPNNEEEMDVVLKKTNENPAFTENTTPGLPTESGDDGVTDSDIQRATENSNTLDIPETVTENTETATRTKPPSEIESKRKVTEESKNQTAETEMDAERRFMPEEKIQKEKNSKPMADERILGQEMPSVASTDDYQSVYTPQLGFSRDPENIVKHIANYGNTTERINASVTRTTEKSNVIVENLKPEETVPVVENKPSVKIEMNDDTRRVNKEWSRYIENKHVTINLDPASQKISSFELSNGVNISLDIQFYYYASDEPEKLGRSHMRNPGAYTFRSVDNQPVPLIDYLDTQIYKTPVVEEVHTSYCDWASIAVRLYADQPFIEVEWLVGPVPVDDGIGKEVFIRYMTDLVNHGVFYTDSNGRQTIKRMRNYRPTYDMLNTDEVAGNYYPVTSKIYIEDLAKNIRFSILNDRSQGGTSLFDGEIDLMVQRRILTTDSSVETTVNDTRNGAGVMIRGKHYLYLSKADYRPNKMFEKKLAKEIELRPQIFVSDDKPYGASSKEKWKGHNNEMSFLKHKLPVGIHVLTLEQWNDGTILLRLENYLEKSDAAKSGKKKVFIKELFTNIRINEVRETTLAANMWLSDFAPLNWTKNKFMRNFNDFYASYKTPEFAEEDVLRSADVDISAGITLVPQQIRTFVCIFDYVD